MFDLTEELRDSGVPVNVLHLAPLNEDKMAYEDWKNGEHDGRRRLCTRTRRVPAWY
jgi:hypothetical protein